MHRILDEPLPLRMFTLVLLVAGYFWIYRPAEDHLTQLQISTQHMTERAAFGEALLAKRDLYERAAERMRTELSGIAFDTNNATMMATFLDDVAAKTQAHHITLAEVVPDHDASARTTLSALTLHVHGAYEPVIAFLSDMNTMHTLVRLDALKITRLSGDVHAGQTPTIDATINASLVPIHTDTTGPLE